MQTRRDLFRLFGAAIAALIVCLHPDAVRRIAAAIHLVCALLAGDMRLH